MKIGLFLIISLVSRVVFSQYQGPVPEITSGYGSEGSNSISVVNITNDYFLLKDISVFYPTGTTAPIPTIYFSHGYGGNDTTNYIGTLKNIASNGYAVVFVPYKTIGVTVPERYLTLYDGFIKASENLPTIIDTTRVGFFGHSFGGGATPRLAYRLFSEKNWGANGKFIYCSAPWYSYELGTSNLTNFPTDCNMLTVLFDSDDVNDHRMGMDIFNNIAIHDSIKDCILVSNDTVSGHVYQADHGLPAQNSLLGVFDAYDYYVTFRLLGALADYTFTGNLAAKDVALGNGSSSQMDMGTLLTPLSVSDTPSPLYQEAVYDYPCSDSINERQTYCQSILGVETFESDALKVYPNPSSGEFTLVFPAENSSEVIVMDIFGRAVQEIGVNSDTLSISIAKAGIYFIKTEYGTKTIMVTQ